MAKKQSVYAAIDIGSDKIVCVTGIIDTRERCVKILGNSIISCPDGIKAGVITDIQEATIAVYKACYESGNTANGIIKNAVLALRGSYIEGKNSKGIANTDDSDRRVTEHIVAAVLDSAGRKVRLGSEQEVFQVVPKEFIVSSQRGIKNPIGKECSFLEVDALSFVASADNLNEARYALEQAKIPSSREVYGYIAASEVVVNKDEKDSGCLVIDCSDLTTGFVLYVDGILKYANEIQVGSYHIAKDIAHALRASLSVAKEIKEKYGSVLQKVDLKDTEFKYIADENDKIIKSFEKKELSKVIAARVDQTLYHINEVLIANRYDNNAFLSGGIIITGGGSLLNGMVEACKQYFGCSVRIGYPLATKVTGQSDIVSNPAYTTAIGALASFLSEPYAVEPKRISFGLLDKLWQSLDKYL